LDRTNVEDTSVSLFLKEAEKVEQMASQSSSIASSQDRFGRGQEALRFLCYSHPQPNLANRLYLQSPKYRCVQLFVFWCLIYDVYKIMLTFHFGTVTLLRGEKDQNIMLFRESLRNKKLKPLSEMIRLQVEAKVPLLVDRSRHTLSSLIRLLEVLTSLELLPLSSIYDNRSPVHSS
jgi:hypothetical protein